MNVLMVLTSHAVLCDAGERSGFRLEEFAAPYYSFVDARAEVVLASPAGGQPPVGPSSEDEDAQTEATRRFSQDEAAQQALANTRKLAEIDHPRFDAVFYPGGHGSLWDLAEDAHSIELIETIYAEGTPLGLVGHAPGVLRRAKNDAGGPLVHGLKMTGFTNSEHDALGLADGVPFRVEDMLIEQGAEFVRGPDWKPYVVSASNLVTGQNSASALTAARILIAQLQPK